MIARVSRVLTMILVGLLLGAMAGCWRESRPAPTSTAPATVVVPTPPPSATPTLTPRPTATAAPTATVSPSATPTATTTPFPTVTPPPFRPTKPALIAAGWLPGDGGNTSWEYLGITLLDMFIYPDGQVVWLEGQAPPEGEGYRLVEANISTEQICSLLNEMAENGFFDQPWTNDGLYAFDESTQFSDGAGAFVISVNGPLSLGVSFYGPYLPYLKPAPAALFELLSQFRPIGGQLYSPDAMVLWVETDITNSPVDETAAWPTDLPDLSMLSNRLTGRVIVRDELLAPLLELFDHRLKTLHFVDESVDYLVTMRPLLPHEPLYPTGDDYFSYYGGRLEQLPFMCPKADWLTVTPTAPWATPPTRTPDAGIRPLAAGGRILYTSNRDGNAEIYVADADGTRETRLTNHPSEDRSPSWSPDGSHVAFSSNRDGNFEIYVMNADGSEVTRLTHDSADDDQPAWSPDGRKLAFVSARISSSNRYEINNYNLFVMNADGTQLLRITERGGKVLWPAWSPDGMTIAFTRDARSFDYKLYLVSSEAVGERYIADGGMPAWSPDGQQIAVACGINICVVDHESGETATLTDLIPPGPYSSWTAHPDWSGDGSYIIFESVAGGISGFHLYAVSVADGALFWLNNRTTGYAEWWP